MADVVPNIPGLAQKQVNELVQFWETHWCFQGSPLIQGRDIVEIIGHFYSHELSFELKVPAPNLKSEVLDALKVVFWFLETKRTEIRVVNVDEMRLDLRISLGNYLIDHQTRLLRDCLEAKEEELDDMYGYDATYGIRVWMWNKIKKGIDVNLAHHVNERFRKTLWNSCSDYIFEGDSIAGSMQAIERFLEGIANSLLNCIFFAIGFTLTRYSSQCNLSPLLAIWRSGNLPVGFDTNDNFLVLCAEKK